MKEIGIRFLGGSGFLVTIGDTGLLFDACSPKNGETGAETCILPDKKELEEFERLYVFFSSSDPEHYAEETVLRCPENASFFLGGEFPQEVNGLRLTPGSRQDFGDLSIETFASTGKGAAFLVGYRGVRLFHAGSLNLWHWRDTSTIPEIEAAEKAFYDCVEPIPKGTIDAAFFPVDPRQGSMYDAGAGYFIMTVKPKVFVPMQFRGRSDVIRRFGIASETPFTKIAVLEKAGETVSLHIAEDEESAPDDKLREFLERTEEDGGDAPEA